MIPDWLIDIGGIVISAFFFVCCFIAASHDAAMGKSWVVNGLLAFAMFALLVSSIIGVWS